MAINIGNSNIMLAIHNGTSWSSMHRLDSRIEYSPNIYTDYVYAALEQSQAREESSITTTIISSVVPRLTSTIEQAVRPLVSCRIILAELTLKSPLASSPPSEMGQDLFANAIAGYVKSNVMIKKSVVSSVKAMPTASITIDMGTALTFTVVNGKGKIMGVAIAPGLETSYVALVNNTALIAETRLQVPTSALGTTTQEALNSGLVLGFSYLIEGMITQIKHELNENTKVYITGGYGSLMESLVTHLIDEGNMYHTLDGLYLLCQYNQ